MSDTAVTIREAGPEDAEAIAGLVGQFGYPTPAHRDAIRLHGSSTYHRNSFRLLPEEQLEIGFEE